MLQAWLSIGYIVLLAALVLAFSLWRRGSPVLAIAALVVGIPLWFGWEYARPTWTSGLITGTEVRRSDPDARGHTTDIAYIYMRHPSDRAGGPGGPVWAGSRRELPACGARTFFRTFIECRPPSPMLF